MTAKTSHGLTVLDRSWRTDEITMVKGDRYASVRLSWCTNDPGKSWRWAVDRIVEGSDNESVASGYDLTFDEAKAAAEACIAAAPDLAVYRFAGMEPVVDLMAALKQALESATSANKFEEGGSAIHGDGHGGTAGEVGKAPTRGACARVAAAAASGAEPLSSIRTNDSLGDVDAGGLPVPGEGKQAEAGVAPVPLQSYGNCGECLMNDVQVVELGPDGKCPRCKTDYGAEP